MGKAPVATGKETRSHGSGPHVKGKGKRTQGKTGATGWSRKAERRKAEEERRSVYHGGEGPDTDAKKKSKRRPSAKKRERDQIGQPPIPTDVMNPRPRIRLACVDRPPEYGTYPRHVARSKASCVRVQKGEGWDYTLMLDESHPKAPLISAGPESR